MAAEKRKDADGTDGSAAVPVPRGSDGGDGAEVSEDQARVIERAAAIDVAKGFGMVCTRVPGSRAGSPPAEGVAGGGHLPGGGGADGSPALRGDPAAGAGGHLRNPGS